MAVMNVLVGVDTAGGYQQALEMVLRLGIKDLHLHLVNCVSPVMVDGSFPDGSAGGVLAEINDQIRRDGLVELESAEAASIPRCAGVTTAQVMGDTAAQLVHYADEHTIDLVAVASANKDYLGSLFFGSVAKGLVASCHRSVLVVKSAFQEVGPVKAVVASDHSDYFGKCLEMYEGWGVSGVGSYHVVSAFGAVKQLAPKYADAVGRLGELSQAAMVDEVNRKNRLVGLKLDGLGATVTSEAVYGRPGPVIDEAYAAQKADLLILGAQGHGFMERLTMGSVSFHQVVSTAHNTLILRV